MAKSTTAPVAAILLAATLALALLAYGNPALAQTPPAPAASPVPAPAAAAPAAPPAPAVQTTPLYVSAVDLEIVPSAMSKFLAALEADGSAMIQEAHAREFDSAVGEKDKAHVFVFEVYDDAAAYDAHQKTLAYAKFIGLTMALIKNYNIRPFTTVVQDRSNTAAAGAGPFFVNQIELDIDPAKFDQFMAAAKANAAAAVQDPGVREFAITVSQNDPHHLLQFEVYDSAAAHEAHVATDHFKAYRDATKDMVLKRQVTPQSSVQMLTKAQ